MKIESHIQDSFDLKLFLESIVIKAILEVNQAPIDPFKKTVLIEALQKVVLVSKEIL